jgi:hypothetical protein
MSSINLETNHLMMYKVEKMIKVSINMIEFMI